MVGTSPLNINNSRLYHYDLIKNVHKPVLEITVKIYSKLKPCSYSIDFYSQRHKIF